MREGTRERGRERERGQSTEDKTFTMPPPFLLRTSVETPIIIIYHTKSTRDLR